MDIDARRGLTPNDLGLVDSVNSPAITIASVTPSAEPEFGKADGGVSALGVSHFVTG
jgi:hypothetical protein